MSTRTVSVSLSSELATRYERASDEERQKVQASLEVLLRELIDKDARPLGAIMDDISDKAQARGLMPERLSELLDDER